MLSIGPSAGSAGATGLLAGVLHLSCGDAAEPDRAVDEAVEGMLVQAGGSGSRQRLRGLSGCFCAVFLHSHCPRTAPLSCCKEPPLPHHAPALTAAKPETFSSAASARGTRHEACMLQLYSYVCTCSTCMPRLEWASDASGTGRRIQWLCGCCCVCDAAMQRAR
eukprot:COSAG05_NODE_225_length_13597_cov_18.878723_8_plen_164_part_00